MITIVVQDGTSVLLCREVRGCALTPSSLLSSFNLPFLPSAGARGWMLYLCVCTSGRVPKIYTHMHTTRWRTLSLQSAYRSRLIVSVVHCSVGDMVFFLWKTPSPGIIRGRGGDVYFFVDTHHSQQWGDISPRGGSTKTHPIYLDTSRCRTGGRRRERR